MNNYPKYNMPYKSVSKDIFELSIIFYECYVNKAMYRCPEDILYFISINKELFPAKMRGLATYWYNERCGKHKLPSDAQRKAREINWSLHQLMGARGNIQIAIDTLFKHRINEQAISAICIAEKEIGFTIHTIRQHNFALTNKPSKQEQRRLNYYNEEGKEIS